MSGLSLANDDLDGMTLMQLLQSFPEPPITVYIDPSYYPTSKPNPRQSVIISSPLINTPTGSPLSHSPSTIIISPVTSPNLTPLNIPIHNNNSSHTLTTSSSSPVSLSPSTSLNGNNGGLSPLMHANSSPTSTSLSHSGPFPPGGKSNGLSHPLHAQVSQISISQTPLRSSAPAILAPTPAAPVDPIEFITRGCKGELQGQEWQRMNDILIELSPDNLNSTLEKCYENQRQALSKSKFSMKKSEEQQFLKVSKNRLDFGYEQGKLCPLDTELADELVLTNIGPGKARFKVSPVPPATTHILNITPKDGILKKKQTMSIQFKLKVRTTTKLRKVITIEVEGGCKYFIVISVDSEKSVFGVGVDELETVEDNGLQVPAVLVTLRNYLYDHSGLRHEGVFRVQGDEKELQRIKNQLNKGTFTDCVDVNCIASLIKLWYRELPAPILNIPIESLRTLEAEAECVAVYNDLPEPNKTLMTWLMDVLADASLQEAYNKMTPRNFAICCAPNLFTSTGTNPADSLFISSKVVHFVSQVLNYRLRLKFPAR